jgi:hypothetical protein
MIVRLFEFIAGAMARFTSPFRRRVYHAEIAQCFSAVD